jgi:tight adherence protein B
MTALVSAVLVMAFAWLLAAGRASSMRATTLHGRQPLAGWSFGDVHGRAVAWWNERPGQHEHAIRAALPECLDDIARSLRTGLSLTQAMESAAETTPLLRGELARVLEPHARGQGLAEACRSWAAQARGPDVKLTASALTLAATTGGDAARAVDVASTVLRDRAALAEEVRAQSAQARLSALVIGLLPVAFTTWCALTDRRVAAFLLASRLGVACLVGGLGLEVVGVLWMARLVRSVT